MSDICTARIAGGSQATLGEHVRALPGLAGGARVHSENEKQLCSLFDTSPILI